MSTSLRRMLPAGCLFLLFAVAACVTVNIYFPAAEVERTAENIVKDVYGSEDGAPANTPEKSKPDSSSLEVFLAFFGPTAAHAADATSVSNSAIRGLKSQIAQNHQSLASFYDAGAVGITNDGMLDLRDTGGLSMGDVAQLKRLVNADNQARSQLYAEVAKALNVDPSQVSKVREIFAEQWQSQAKSGWWIQTSSGSWKRK